MAALLDTIYLIILSIVTLIGILSSSFIVALNLLDWVNSRPLNTCDYILVAVGISCASSQCTLVGQTYVYMFWTEAYVLNVICPILAQLLEWFSSSSYWFTACLCIFYCVKIVDFNHRPFVWIKLRISKVVPWLLMGSAVGTLVLSIPIYWIPYADVIHVTTTNLMDNSTVPVGELKLKKFYTLVLTLFGFILPLLIDVTSITLIFTSLSRHTHRMKENAAGFCKPRLDAHFGAVRIMGLLFLVYISVILAECVRLVLPSHTLDAVIWIIFASAVPAQTIILILGNTKLKEGFWKILKLWRT